MPIFPRSLSKPPKIQTPNILHSVHYINFHSTMPLVVPNLNQGDKNEWLTKLAGKTITENTNDVTSFAKKDLPQSHRILKPGDMKTMDHNPERLNVHLDENGTVHDVNFG
ncbi:hypothetical protein BDV28DRAFT_132305 [Aspergillus coremiiformis]|uniref:Peptidase inhibitor I78 family-domain-containing protein n=1 Tax=Aspergillus coremiiformis TaxID=138285 RepID=A0A5N6Z8U3_9EURO|nr:hypothetical protein BDV28DRAFT_132305 [Aspergillus coremiiformis]